MTITYRGVKDEALTYAEVDENFRDLREDTDLQRVLTNGNTSNLVINIEQITANSIITSNLTLGGVNAIARISSAYDQANTSRNSANTVSDSASAGYGQANTARSHANAAFAKANSALANTTTTLAGSLTMQSIRLTSNTTVTTSGDAGSTGQIYWDGNYLYICVATNQWKRVDLLSW